MKTGVNVSEAMTRKPVYIEAEDSIINCAKKMKKNDVGSLVVKKNHEFLGFITEHDFVSLLTNKNVELNNIKVKDIMISKNDTVSVEPDVDLYDAIRVMQDEDFRRLPVVNNGKLLGLLTVKDVLKIQPQLFDLLVEKYELRDESDKIFFSDGLKKECDICNVSGSVFNVRGKHLCRACRDTL